MYLVQERVDVTFIKSGDCCWGAQVRVSSKVEVGQARDGQGETPAHLRPSSHIHVLEDETYWGAVGLSTAHVTAHAETHHSPIETSSISSNPPRDGKLICKMDDSTWESRHLSEKSHFTYNRVRCYATPLPLLVNFRMECVSAIWIKFEQVLTSF